MFDNGKSLADKARKLEVGKSYNYAKIEKLTIKSANKGHGCASLAVARWHLCGMGREINREQAAHFFKEAIVNGCQCAEKESYFRGFFSQQESIFSDGIDIINFYCSSLLENIVKYGMGIGTYIDKIKAKSLLTVFSNNKMKNCEHRSLAESFFENVLHEDDFIATFRSCVYNIDAKIHQYDHNHIEYIWQNVAHKIQCASVSFNCFAVIARANGWINYDIWRRYAVWAEVKFRGIRYKKFVASHGCIGLLSNQETRNGVIIPFKYLTYRNTPDTHLTRLDGISVQRTGYTIKSIVPIGTYDENLPTLIYGNDIVVAMCLAFLEDETPSISLDSPGRHSVNPRSSMLLYKDFTPRWLAATDFGGALYCADIMAGRFDSTRGIVSFRDPLVLEWDDNANLVSGLFSFYSPTHPMNGTDTYRIMIKLVSVEASSIRNRNKGLFTNNFTEIITFDNVNIRVDGSGMNYTSRGSEISYLNDPRYPEAHQGLMLTNRLSLLENAFPVFKRVKYLLALTSMMLQLKSRGMVPSREIWDELVQVRQSLIDKSRDLDLHIAPP